MILMADSIAGNIFGSLDCHFNGCNRLHHLEIDAVLTFSAFDILRILPKKSYIFTTANLYSIGCIFL